MSQFVADNELLMLVATASTFFVLNTAPVACVISLTEQKPLKKVWSECYFWSFPYYLLGAAIAGIVELVDKKAGWQSSLLILPVAVSAARSLRAAVPVPAAIARSLGAVAQSPDVSYATVAATRQSSALVFQ